MNTTQSIFLGIDPDLSSTALAWVSNTGKVVSLGIMRSESGVLPQIQRMAGSLIMSKADAVAVENQVIYPSGPNRTKRPMDILHLGQVAGACVFMSMGMSSAVYFPTPSEWKGQVDKIVTHRRFAHLAGIDPRHTSVAGGKSPYLVLSPDLNIPGQNQLNPSDYKHVMDAIGLAQYAARRYHDESLKQSLLQKARSHA